MNRAVWVRDPALAWVPGEIVDRDDETATVLLTDTQTRQTPLSDLLERNPLGEAVDDLIQLPHLHEAEILDTLDRRYRTDRIYTDNGPILIAVNPFKPLPIYTTGFVERHRDRRSDESHLYAIAQRAHDNLTRRGENQTILASGESGSGKTVTTKYLLDYYAKTTTDESVIGVEQLILEANPILEAFGNAKTVMNDNSSRFGKFIRLDFADTGQMVSGEIDTYLLEKVRVVRQNPGERNFHIFYLIAAGALETDRILWGFRPKFDYRLLSHPEVGREDGVDDAEEYQRLRLAFDRLGFEGEFIDAVFTLLAGLLELAETDFSDFESIRETATLLRVEPDSLHRWMTSQTRVIHGEKLVSQLEPSEVAETVETLIQTVYDRMFQLIVDRINRRLSPKPTGKFIGILDIFGFEIFDTNSLEQLHINYTNEVLQQLFNHHIFKLEQQEYVKEGVEWDPIDFPDNADRLEALASNSSLFSLLNDQCRAPQGSDRKLFTQYQRKFEPSKLFAFEPLKAVDQIFSFDHYAGWVDYTLGRFCHKNQLFYRTEIEEMVEALPIDLKLPHQTQMMTLTSSLLFKRQLDRLRETISKTTPHFVRCLKPNDRNRPNDFNRVRILEQLRYGGVLEAVRVSRAGFPVRFIHCEFTDRYHCLGSILDPEYLASSGVAPDTLQKGKTKYFLKQTSYDRLEDLRFRRIVGATVEIQSFGRMIVVRNRYRRLRQSTITAQSAVRRWLANRRTQRLREQRATRRIGGWWRERQRRLSFLRLKSAAIAVQRFIRLRRWRAELSVRCLNRRTERAATLLTQTVRNWLTVRRDRRDRRAAEKIHRFLKRWIRDYRRRKWSDVHHLTGRISDLEKELGEMKLLRDTLLKREQEKEISDQVSHELCGKMNDLMLQNSQLREELAMFRRQQQKKRGLFSVLFG